MLKAEDNKAILKILIGVAWIDGKVQPQERDYILKLAKQHQLLEDAELKPLLYGLRSVSMEECYRWIADFLGQHPTVEDGNDLIEAISGLIYSDGEVASEEAKLVTRLLTVNTNQSKPQHLYESMVKAMQQLYERWRQKIA